MSKQLTISATLSVLAMAVLAFGTAIGGPEQGGSADRAAAAHGSLIRVLIQA